MATAGDDNDTPDELGGKEGRIPSVRRNAHIVRRSAIRKNKAVQERTWWLGDEFSVAAPKNELLSDALDTVFGQMAAYAAGECARSHLDLDYQKTVGGFQLLANGEPMVRTTSESELAPLLEGMLLGYAVRTRRDCTPFHAATVALRGQGVLLLGPKGRGKSTLALSLAEEGAMFLGDEVAFVHHNTLALHAFPKAGTLKRGSFALFPKSRTFLDPIRGPVRYHLPRHVANLVDPAFPIRLIVAPEYRGSEKEGKLEPLPPEKLALLLVEQCFGGLERSVEALNVVARLSTCAAYRAVFPNSHRGKAMVKGLLE